MELNCNMTSWDRLKECVLLWIGILVVIVYVIPKGVILGTAQLVFDIYKGRIK